MSEEPGFLSDAHSTRQQLDSFASVQVRQGEACVDISTSPHSASGKSMFSTPEYRRRYMAANTHRHLSYLFQT